MLIFIGQASLEKKNVNKTLSFTKTTLLVLGFYEIIEEAQNWEQLQPNDLKF